MGIILLMISLGGAIIGGIIINFNNYGNINQEKKEIKRIIEQDIDKSLSRLFKETYPHISEDELKILLKKEKDTNYIRKSLNISLKPKE